MLMDQIYTAFPKQYVVFEELCEKIEPKPLFCELSDELKLRSVSFTGTALTYTSISVPTISGIQTQMSNDY